MTYLITLFAILGREEQKLQKLSHHLSSPITIALLICMRLLGQPWTAPFLAGGVDLVELRLGLDTLSVMESIILQISS